MSKPMTLTADVLRRAQLVMPKNDVRYYLNYVKVEAHPVKGAVLIATDGRRLLVIRDADAENVKAGGTVRKVGNGNWQNTTPVKQPKRRTK